MIELCMFVYVRHCIRGLFPKGNHRGSCALSVRSAGSVHANKWEHFDKSILIARIAALKWTVCLPAGKEEKKRRKEIKQSAQYKLR